MINYLLLKIKSIAKKKILNLVKRNNTHIDGQLDFIIN